VTLFDETLLAGNVQDGRIARICAHPGATGMKHGEPGGELLVAVGGDQRVQARRKGLQAWRKKRSMSSGLCWWKKRGKFTMVSADRRRGAAA
jgi:hypothetical protein